MIKETVRTYTNIIEQTYLFYDNPFDNMRELLV